MRPQFSSTLRALAFAALLLVLLSAPAVVSVTATVDRRSVYPPMSGELGEYGWIERKVFVDRGDVDIAFAGSSRMWTAIDARYVQSQLSAQLHRRAEVFTLGWNWTGYDQLYLIARDLLDHRRVHTLVIYDDVNASDGDLPHPQLYRTARLGDFPDAFRDLPWRAGVRHYAGAVLGLPRHLLSLVRPDEDDPARWGDSDLWRGLDAADPVEQLGSLRARAGYGDPRPPFEPYRPAGRVRPDDVEVFSGATREAFAFDHRQTGPYQSHFARALGRLCVQDGVQLVMLHVPTITEQDQTAIPERMPPAEIVDAPADLIGIPGAALFAGIPASDLPKLFYNPFHVNQNGQDLFTTVLTPTLLRLYALKTQS
ncbi:unnamed protein product [uncultured bacterium]|nr:unnamed protein product [uncultured bacterium]